MTDIRYGIRRLVRDWRFTIAAILILGLGIGVNAAVFSVVNMALFRPQPFSDPDHLVNIFQNASNGSRGGAANSYPAYLDMAKYIDVFSGVTTTTFPDPVSYRDGGAIGRAVVEYTTSTYLSVLGLSPSRGRWFDSAEDVRGADVVAVLGHRTWERKFHADPSVIGRTIRVEGVPVTIVGVGPAAYNGTFNIGLVTDLWLPVSAIPLMGGSPRALERRPFESPFTVKARLRAGVTMAQAQAAMSNLGVRLAAEYPDEDPGAGISVVHSSDIRVFPELDTLFSVASALLLGVVGLVLAIACSNLATLLLVRGASRAREIAVRLAIGATRGQLVRHLLMESLLLSGAGGVAGCAMAWAALQWLRTLDLPVSLETALDYRVLMFVIALSLVTGVAFGLAPALRTTKVDLLSALRDQGETRSTRYGWLSLKNALVVFQVAVSVMLLAGTSFILQISTAARRQNPGFAQNGVAILQSTTEVAPMIEEFRRRVAVIPGVKSAAVAAGLPMQTTGSLIVVDAGAESNPKEASFIWAGPGLLETLEIPILFGRAFNEEDRLDSPRAAVVNESMAQDYFGTANAVGRRFRMEPDANAWFEVIGVARNTGTADLSGDLINPQRHLFFRSFRQANRPATTVIARTALDAAGLVLSMQRELRGVSVELPVISARSMTQYMDDSLVGPRTVATFFGGLGALGLSLASIGLYAVVAFSVARRSREIGIRMALGARSRQVIWTVAREVALLVGVGTGIGLALSVMAILAFRLIGFSTPGISIYRPSVDLISLLAIAVFMAIVGIAAAFVPARRAAKMDPLSALRRE